jgi:hypothetical protein
MLQHHKYRSLPLDTILSHFHAPPLHIIIICYSWVGVRLSPLGTSATTGLTEPSPDDDDECGAVGGMRNGRGNRSTGRKPAPVPICTPHIPHNLRPNTGPAVGIRRLTASAMARPTELPKFRLNVTLSSFQSSNLMFAKRFLCLNRRRCMAKSLQPPRLHCPWQV